MKKMPSCKELKWIGKHFKIQQSVSILNSFSIFPNQNVFLVIIGVHLFQTVAGNA